jgi:hypothetical protein
MTGPEANTGSLQYIPRKSRRSLVQCKMSLKGEAISNAR